jgi:hypothetical protein
MEVRRPCAEVSVGRIEVEQYSSRDGHADAGGAAALRDYPGLAVLPKNDYGLLRVVPPEVNYSSLFDEFFTKFWKVFGWKFEKTGKFVKN